MRKTWQRFFLLCVACMICMSGLCLAKDGNWIKYHNHDSSKYYVDPSSLKAREYEGRKYLEANVDIGGSQMLIVLDIENQKYIVLEGHNHLTGKTTNTDISQMSQQSPTFSGIPIYEKLIRWVEKNRPDVINEIRTNNLTAPPLPSAPQSAPGAKTSTTGAPNVLSGSSEAIVGDIEYEVLESGAVKFSPRCMSLVMFGDLSAHTDDIYAYADSYYIFKKPMVFKAFPGAYVVGKPDYYDGTIGIYSSLPTHRESTFDYDPKTQMFTFYKWDLNDTTYDVNHPNYTFKPLNDYNNGLTFRMRLIDKNTVYIEDGTPYMEANGEAYRNESYFTNTYRYMPYDKIQHTITKVDPPFFDYDYPVLEYSFTKKIDEIIIQHGHGYFDDNQCVWFGKQDANHAYVDFYYGFTTELTAYVDMARAFLAVNGNVGEAPSGGLVIGSDPYAGWYDLIMEDGRIVRVEASN